jgi:hypothetical protein
MKVLTDAPGKATSALKVVSWKEMPPSNRASCRSTRPRKIALVKRAGLLARSSLKRVMA